MPSAAAFVCSAACDCEAVDAALLAEHKPRSNCLVAEGPNLVKMEAGSTLRDGRPWYCTVRSDLNRVKQRDVPRSKRKKVYKIVTPTRASPKLSEAVYKMDEVSVLVQVVRAHCRTHRISQPITFDIRLTAGC